MELKDEIEKECFFGKPLVKVWINENETEDGSETSWEACIKQASTCDIFLSLMDGDAGWQKGEPRNKSGIGICHAEFETAHSTSPAKVRVISLLGEKGKVKTRTGPDLDYVNAIQKADFLEAVNIKDSADLKQRVKGVVREMVLQLSLEGAQEVKKSGANTGQALDWSRMNFTERQAAMIDVLTSSLKRRKGGEEVSDGVKISVAGKSVLFRPSAIPAAFNVSAAREMVGQPFLKDHEYNEVFKNNIGGPVHVIACQKNVTETQAMGLLGFPDATIISGAFGVYVADKIQKIQLCLISNCRDAASTKHGLQRLFDWLERTGEDKLLAKRSMSRAKILKVISGEKE